MIVVAEVTVVAMIHDSWGHCWFWCCWCAHAGIAELVNVMVMGGGVADYDDDVDADCGAGYVGVAGA